MGTSYIYQIKPGFTTICFPLLLKKRRNEALPFKSKEKIPLVQLFKKKKDITRENKIYLVVSSLSSPQKLSCGEEMVNCSFIPSGDKSWEFFLMADTNSRLRTKMWSFEDLMVKTDTRERNFNLLLCAIT